MRATSKIDGVAMFQGLAPGQFDVFDDGGDSASFELTSSAMDVTLTARGYERVSGRIVDTEGRPLGKGLTLLVTGAGSIPTVVPVDGDAGEWAYATRAPRGTRFVFTLQGTQPATSLGELALGDAPARTVVDVVDISIHPRQGAAVRVKGFLTLRGAEGTEVTAAIDPDTGIVRFDRLLRGRYAAVLSSRSGGGQFTPSIEMDLSTRLSQPLDAEFPAFAGR